MGISQATVFIRISNVHISTTVSKTFAAELERATKKPPPKTTKIAILTSSYDETAASLSTLSGTAARNAAEIITSVMPRKNGRVFIGFPTAQTTGLLAHISAPSLIPTVERENIDLNARYVRTWNTELLSVAGIACRIAFAGEMGVLRDKSARAMTKSGQKVLDDKQLEALVPAAVHTFKQFTFQDSTPLPRVAQIIEEAFWTCNKNATVDMFSSCGVLPSHEVRIASEKLSFVNRIPVIPEALMKEARDFITKLEDLGLVTDMTTSDIKKELEKQALTEEQLEEFLKWGSQKVKNNALDTGGMQALLSVTVVNLLAETASARRSGDLLVLREISTFINSSRISPDLPVPPYTMPFRFTKNINSHELNMFGWEDLQIVPWLRWLLEQTTGKSKGTELDMTSNSAFAGQVLAVISKTWDSMSQSSKTTVVELLAIRSVIPTKMGMKRPPESYFASVKLFEDLPTISGLNSVKEKFLKALGVRKTIELQVIFQRLMAGQSKGSGGWSHVDLIRYLVGVWQDIPQEEIGQLKMTPLCPAEGPDKQPTSKIYKVVELFEPKESLRGLGLPLLQWPSPLNVYSPEGKFLKLLGLRANPTVPELVDVLIKADKANNATLYEGALRYFIESHYSNNYATFDMTKIQAPFLPLQNGESHQLVRPQDCFTNSKAEVLSYPILRHDLHPHAAKFGVEANPPIADAALRLIKQPPRGRPDARRLFGYFADRLPDISGPVAAKLASAAIVPIPPTRAAEQKGSVLKLVQPTSVFIGTGDEYGDIFDYVDFGEDINLFLLRIGSKREPTITEVVQLLVQDAKRIAAQLGMERYRNLLYKIHLNLGNLKKDKVLWRDMKAAPFLLAIKEKGVEKRTNGDGDSLDDDAPQPARPLEYSLRKAEDIVLQDDLIAYSLFKDYVITAPQEDVLEELYWSLGSPYISTLVDEEPRFGARIEDQSAAALLKELVPERAQLFLHERPDNTIQHDAKWLEKNLEIEVVSSISLRRTLRGHNASHTEKRSASRDTKKKTKLYITSKYDVWQISQEVVQLLIQRPKTQQVMLFETFLTTPLLKLRSRGYNVDRILRKRQLEEKRAAEAAERKRQDEEKARQQRLPVEVESLPERPRSARPQPPTVNAIDAEPEQERALQRPHTPTSKPNTMPGAFHDSPLNISDIVKLPPRPETPRSLLSTLSRHFGFDQQGAATPQNQTQAQRGQLAGAAQTTTNTGMGTGNGSGGGMSPANVLQTLQSAVNSSRSHNSNTLYSPPTTSMIPEISSYCDNTPSHDLTLLGTLPTSGLRVYLANTASPTPASSTFLRTHAQGLEYFATILLASASVFPLAKSSIHIFHDGAANNKTIAFNQAGALFFNYSWFAKLHLAGIHEKKGRGEAVAWWFTTMCHELAHNLVREHSAGHSWWTESFVSAYFLRVGELIERLSVVTEGGQ